jgi:hypothetical protein
MIYRLSRSYMGKATSRKATDVPERARGVH